MKAVLIGYNKTMGLKKKEYTGRVYASILQSDGSIRIGSAEGVEGAVLREYENPITKEAGSKWELIFDEIEALVTGFEVKELKNGEILNVFLADDDGEYVLAVAAGSNYATDIMRKLHNCDFKEKVTFTPYSFAIEGTDKKRRGVTVYQKGDKVLDYFFDAEKKESKNGMIKPGADMDKKKWKRYFEDVAEFLQGEMKKLEAKTNFPNSPVKKDNTLPHYDESIKKNSSSEDIAAKLNEKGELNVDKIEFSK